MSPPAPQSRRIPVSASPALQCVPVRPSLPPAPSRVVDRDYETTLVLRFCFPRDQESVKCVAATPASGRDVPAVRPPPHTAPSQSVSERVPVAGSRAGIGRRSLGLRLPLGLGLSQDCIKASPGDDALTAGGPVLERTGHGPYVDHQSATIAWYTRFGNSPPLNRPAPADCVWVSTIRNMSSAGSMENVVP